MPPADRRPHRPAGAPRGHTCGVHTTPAESSQGHHLVETDLDRLSNSVVSLVEEGRLDEADAACEQLRTRYPEVHDWLMRKAMVCEARGETELRKAANHFTRTSSVFETRSTLPAKQASFWKPHPRTIHFLIGQDVFETGPTSPVPERGDAPEGEPAVRKPRRNHLDSARREAPGPWRIGGRDDAGIHVLDANEERVATIWNAPSRSVSALEAIEALVVRIGDEVLATRLCANPECGRAFDAPAVRRSTARLCVAWQLSHVSSRPASETSARMNCACGGSHGKRSPSAVVTPIASGRKYAPGNTRAVTG